MATIITRETGATAKGSPLTNAEVDANFINLNTEVTPSRPELKPSLLLNFSNSESIDSRLKFTRASRATQYNSDGYVKLVQENTSRLNFDPFLLKCKGLLIEEQRSNLVSFTNNILFAYSSLNNCLIPENANIVSPDGKATCSKIREDDSNLRHETNVDVSVVNGVKYTVSVYAKAAERSNLALSIAGAPSATFNLLDGTFVVSGAASATITKLENNWYRCTMTSVYGGATGQSNIYLGIENTGVNGYSAHQGIYGNGIYIWGLQLESGAFATSLIPSNDKFVSRSTRASYFNKDGILKIADANQKRNNHVYDFYSKKWISQDLFLEKSATNLYPDSTGTLTQLSQTTVTPYATTAPDGSSDAQRLQISGNYAYKYFPGVLGNSVKYTWSFFFKPVNNYFRFSNGGTPGSFSYYVDCSTQIPTVTSFSNGSNSTNHGSRIEPVGNGWFRFICTVSMSGSTGYMEVQWSYGSSGTADLYVWGIQLEAGSVATSYIPTYGSTVSRAEDVAASTTTTRSQETIGLLNDNFSSWYNPDEGCFYAEADTAIDFTDSTQRVNTIHLSDEAVSKTLHMGPNSVGGNSSNRFYINPVVGDACDLSISTTTKDYKIAGAYTTNNAAYAVNGQITTDAAVTVPKEFYALHIGSRIGGEQSQNGHIRVLKYYPKRLSNSELLALTK